VNAPIAIAPMHNSPGKKDATGAFLPEARAFAKLHGGKVLLFDNSKPSKDRFTDVIDALTGRQAHCVAFFCHGLKTSLQVGATLRNVHVLAAALRDAGCTTVPLFACDTARDADRDHADDMADGSGGAGGFASALSAALPEARVYGHTVTAHTTKALTGIQGFDEITDGGLPRGRTTLVMGGPGCGKTVFALQSLVNSAHDNKESSIFVAFEENSRQIGQNAATFGWDLPTLERERLFFLDARMSTEAIQAGDFDLIGMLASLSAKAAEIGAKADSER
jgi:hypothetical protein